jgi:hypothetical protein
MTGQKFGMVTIALFVGFGIGYVIFNGNKQNLSISAPQTKQAPGPSAGERLAAIHQACLARDGVHNPSAVSAEEMLRRTANYTQYQMDQLLASYAQLDPVLEENMRQCIEVALYRDPEAAAVYAHVHRAVSGEIR